MNTESARVFKGNTVQQIEISWSDKLAFSEVR